MNSEIHELISELKRLIPKPFLKKLRPLYHFALSAIAAFYYGRPSEKMVIIGVTGTTGKTTTVYFLAKILKEAGIKAGYTSTALFSDGEKEWLNDKKMTMLGRFFTQKMLRQMLNNNCQVAIVETTSEGIAQFRHRFINYDTLIFTGLYPEHIESHGGFENYKKAKSKLFSHLSKCKTKNLNFPLLGKTKKIKKTIIVNGDDEHADYFSSFWAEKKYELRTKQSDIKPKNNINQIILSNLNTTEQGFSFKLDNALIDMKILGDFNAINASLAAIAAISLDIERTKIKEALENVASIPGHLEKIDLGQNFTIIVDYAFEPRALIKLYETIKKLPHEKIIHVLGATGGGRDKSRREIMGKIAGENADLVLATNEDPYDEDPGQIIDAVRSGAMQAGKKTDINLFRFMDRRWAIKSALKIMRKNDILLITGKGCEQFICEANGQKIPHDDRQAVREELEKLKLNK